MRERIARARRLRGNSTDAERKLWRHLRNRLLDGYRFRRQVPLDRYVVDFVCMDSRLIVELDGDNMPIRPPRMPREPNTSPVADFGCSGSGMTKC